MGQQKHCVYSCAGSAGVFTNAKKYTKIQQGKSKPGVFNHFWLMIPVNYALVIYVYWLGITIWLYTHQTGVCNKLRLIKIKDSAVRTAIRTGSFLIPPSLWGLAACLWRRLQPLDVERGGNRRSIHPISPCTDPWGCSICCFLLWPQTWVSVSKIEIVPQRRSTVALRHSGSSGCHTDCGRVKKAKGLAPVCLSVQVQFCRFCKPQIRLFIALRRI